ncbi:putative efflux protein, MATE family [Anaerosporobacter mobilis DSM 15930]|jgi:putative MATE family efflux protein|uniref:Multidrug export protein MepA n=1 Tax=Anaerosporobacter mobilis DSM 15930 TaxID=1120996 RepID=A0A1M7L608_9FIRM|nr:MATE family efflux transporter [Anaerosporobacter mobilis]SHM73231.1 putative efflux protein, MATE family [Anaerosporobacter mobilis DSM 15930]
MNTFEKKITPGFLLKFTLPSVIMMVFNSFYTMVDGGFVSNFVGTTALSAVNISYPLISLVFAIGIMLASGGSAVVAKQMGEGKQLKAKQSYTFIVTCGVVLGIVIAFIGLFFTKEISLLLGANDAIYEYCYDYILYISIFIPFAILQVLFQFFFVTAGRPNLGLIVTVIGGAANIFLDYLFMGPMELGIKGAAVATGIGFMIPAVIGLIWFAKKEDRILCFTKPKFDGKVLIRTCTNGSSEMVSNLAVAVTTFLFNKLMMRYVGEDGVAALTIVLYAQFLFTAVFLGYTSGIAPLFSYNYGAQDEKRLKKLFKLSIIFITICSILAYAFSLLLAKPVVGLFSEPNSTVYNLAIHGMDLFGISFLFMGFNIFASGLFTSFSNGLISALLSFLRTFVFIILAIMFLPKLLNVDGIWLSIPLAELVALFVSLGYMIRYKKIYQY